MKLTKETIWHFTCDFCKLWWSFASSDEFQPKRNIFCPHCGKENKIDNEVQNRVAPMDTQKKQDFKKSTSSYRNQALIFECAKTCYSHYL